jgi:hypothetical protein
MFLWSIGEKGLFYTGVVGYKPQNYYVLLNSGKLFSIKINEFLKFNLKCNKIFFGDSDGSQILVQIFRCFKQ